MCCVCGVCGFVCGKPGDSCLALAGVTSGEVHVRHYCIPKMMSASIFKTVDASLDWVVPNSTSCAILAVTQL